MSYYVKWVGYSNDEFSWELVEHLTNSADLIAEFHCNHPGAPCPPLERPQSSAPMTAPEQPSRKVSPVASAPPSTSVRHGGRAQVLAPPRKRHRG